jgi:hypothetical protein
MKKIKALGNKRYTPTGRVYPLVEKMSSLQGNYDCSREENKETQLHFINAKKARFVLRGWQGLNPRLSLIRARVCCLDS